MRSSWCTSHRGGGYPTKEMSVSTVAQELFPGFEPFDSMTGDGITIHGMRAGTGMPILLLHGFPQSHVMWHRVAPVLAERFTVVVTDLRGYGDSTLPDVDSAHSPHSFRAMAADQAAVMQRLGFDRFVVVGHDRGARAAHRMALDFSDAVSGIVLLDIMPTEWVYANVDAELALAYYHWFMFPQPDGLPEKFLEADPIGYLHSVLGVGGHSAVGAKGDAYHPSALAEYERLFADPMRRLATIEDYRAAATIDLQHDAQSREAGRLIDCPCHVAWGANGMIARAGHSPVDVWRELSRRPELVTGGEVAGAGHFLVDEFPDEIGQLIADFAASATPVFRRG